MDVQLDVSNRRVSVVKEVDVPDRSGSLPLVADRNYKQTTTTVKVGQVVVNSKPP